MLHTFFSTCDLLKAPQLLVLVWQNLQAQIAQARVNKWSKTIE